MASTARIEELKKKFDENPRRYFAPLANEYRKAGDLAAAIAICRAQLPQQPAHMSGHIVFGQALFESGQYVEAQGVFQTALELDPENLIALRHLGDIARQLGDVETARSWYQRVLEADPRNEEIQALVASLDNRGGIPASEPSGAAAATEPLPVESASATAIPEPRAASAPAPPAEGHRPAAPPAPVEELEIAIPASWSHGAPAAAGPAASAEPPAATAAPLPIPAPPAAAPASVASVDDLTLEGLETTSFEAPAVPQPQAAGLETMSFEAPATSPPPAAGLEGLEPTSWGPPSTSQPASAKAAPAASPSLPAFPEPVPVAPSGPAELTYESAPADSAPLQTGEHAPEEYAAAEATSSPLAGLPMLEDAREESRAQAQVGEPSTAFVTETMAELLLSQGHRDQAIGVYRQLVAQHPGDASLRERLMQLEASRGPSVREFLGAIASWRPANAAPTPSEIAPAPEPLATGMPESRGYLEYAASNGASSYGDFSNGASAPPAAKPTPSAASPRISGSYAVDESYVPPEPPRARAEPTPARAQPSVSPAPRPSIPTPGSLDALFGTGAATPDDGAARALAAAFTPLSTPATPTAPTSARAHEEESPADLLSGRPAHRTERELSLDHIFRNTGAVPRQSGAPTAGVSFDQFFGGEAKPATQTPAPSGPAAEAPQEGDDIQQFNSWLQGLRNR